MSVDYVGYSRLASQGFGRNIPEVGGESHIIHHRPFCYLNIEYMS